jgi:hypothetical protein
MSAALGAEAPLSVARARDMRGKLVADAEKYIGIPYVFGGSDTKGFDCSGLVYRVYRDVLGLGVPRTTKTLYAFAELVEKSKLQPGDLVFFDTTDKLAHVGIFAGDGTFIHAASEGQTTGVTRSSLSDPYWIRTYAGAGRLITPAGYLGFILGIGGGPLFGADTFARGAESTVTLSWPVAGLEPGLQIAPAWDASLGVVRVPLQLSLGLDRHLRFFAGPSFTIGSPQLSEAGGTRSYKAEGGLLGSAGLAWAPFDFKVLGQVWRLVGILTYDRYVADGGAPADAGRDATASIHAGLFLETRIIL